MFDIDSGKLLIVAVLALIVIGPKELPRVLRQVGQSVGKLRRMATEFQGQFMDAMKEADIADIRKELDDLSKSATLDVHFDPARDIQAELTSAMEPAAVTADAATPSPAEGFELPAPVEPGELEPSGAGIAPVAEPVPLDEPAPALVEFNGNAVHPEPAQGKRKIIIKRRTSRLNILQPEFQAQKTGEPLVIRRRIVRAKTSAPEGLPTS